MSKNFRNLFADDDDDNDVNLTYKNGTQMSASTTATTTILAKNISASQTNTAHFNSNNSNRLFGEESTYLDNSTVPTYEEFLKKSSLNANQHFKSQSKRFSYVANNENKSTNTRESVANLVTDDESDDENKDTTENDSANDDEKTIRRLNNVKAPVLTTIQNKILAPASSPFEKRATQTPTIARPVNIHFSSINAIKQPSTPVLAAGRLANLPKTPVSLLRSKQLDRINNTPRSTCKDESCGEYIYFNNKVSQTSFNSSMSSSANKSVYIIVNDSLSGDDDETTTCLERNGQQKGEENNQNSRNVTGGNNFRLHLSDTVNTRDIVYSSSSDNETNANQLPPPPPSQLVPQPPPNYADIREKNLNEFNYQHLPDEHIGGRNNVTQRRKTDNKRISICGDGLTENVFNIDDTVIDQFDNELDYKSGRLCTLSDTTLGEEMRTNDVLSSTKMSNDCSGSSSRRKIETAAAAATTGKNNKPSLPPVNLRAIKESSSDDDQYEKFLNEIKAKNEKASSNTKKTTDDLADFVVDDDFIEVIDEEEEEVQVEAKSVKKTKKPAMDTKKKSAKAKTPRKRAIIYSSNSSSSDNLVKSSSEGDEETPENENENDKFDDQYTKNLQLFYIRTTNKLDGMEKKPNSDNNLKDKKNKKPVKSSSSSSSKVSRSSLLDDSESESESATKSDSLVELNNSSSSSSTHTPPVFSLKSDSDDSDTDSTDIDDKFSKLFRKTVTLTTGKSGGPTKQDTFKTPKKTTNKTNQDERLVKTQAVLKTKSVSKLSFIESLSIVLENEQQRHSDAVKYVNKFKLKKIKEELLAECYAQFNKLAFEDKLPQGMTVKWNGSLRSTGGYCKNSIDRLSGARSCEIHVSTKVCDSAERMRDTLCHEMCHAAAFLINGVRDGHGPIWKSWANRVNFTFKHIPKITVTHSYYVTKKYIFMCQKCKQEIHRHSKSIDVNKEVCGLCYGRFEIVLNTERNAKQLQLNKKEELEEEFKRLALSNEKAESASVAAKKSATTPNLLATPRAPSKFALFVKDNYNSIKREKNLAAHKDVMQELSKQYKSQATNL